MIHISQSHSRISDLTRIIKHKLKNDYFKIWVLNEFMKQNYYPLDLVKQIFLMSYQSIQMSATSNHIMVRMNRIHILCNIASQYHGVICDILKSGIKKIFFRDWSIITLGTDGRVFLHGFHLGKESEPILLLENVKDLKYKKIGECYNSFYVLTNEMTLLVYYMDHSTVFSGNFGSQWNSFWKLHVEMIDILSIDYGFSRIIVLTKKSEVYEFYHDNVEYSQTKIDIPEKTIDVKCGWYHNVALTENNNVYAWGCNAHKQLGHYTIPQKLNVKNIISICCYGDYTILLSIDGTTYSYGEIDS